MEDLGKKILSTFWTVLLTLSLVLGLFDGEQMQKNLEIVRQINVWIVIENIIIIAIVGSSVFGMFKLHRFFKFSIFSIFNWKKEKETGEVTGTNINIMPYKIKYFGIIFILLLMVNVPNFAGMEESWFRQGTLTWGDAILRSFLFGMVHCLVGVPIAAGLAISINGLWLSFWYLQYGNTTMCTVHHTTYNLILFLILLIGITIYSFQKEKKVETDIRELQ